MTLISWYSISLILLALGAAYLKLLDLPLALIFACAFLTPLLVALATVQPAKAPDPSEALKNIEKATQTQSEALSLIVSHLPRP